MFTTKYKKRTEDLAEKASQLGGLKKVAPLLGAPADKVQKILAKYHCPHIMKGLPIASNVAANKKMEPFVRLRTDQTRVVPFNEWFDQKQNVIL